MVMEVLLLSYSSLYSILLFHYMPLLIDTYLLFIPYVRHHAAFWSVGLEKMLCV
jgi:hypothetical protein